MSTRSKFDKRNHETTLSLSLCLFLSLYLFLSLSPSLSPTSMYSAAMNSLDVTRLASSRTPTNHNKYTTTEVVDTPVYIILHGLLRFTLPTFEFSLFHTSHFRLPLFHTSHFSPFHPSHFWIFPISYLLSTFDFPHFILPTFDFPYFILPTFPYFILPTFDFSLFHTIPTFPYFILPTFPLTNSYYLSRDTTISGPLPGYTPGTDRTMKYWSLIGW